MIRYFCNRCDIEVKKSDVLVATTQTADGVKKSYHYCPECRVTIEAFLSGKKPVLVTDTSGSMSEVKYAEPEQKEVVSEETTDVQTVDATADKNEYRYSGVREEAKSEETPTKVEPVERKRFKAYLPPDATGMAEDYVPMADDFDPNVRPEKSFRTKMFPVREKCLTSDGTTVEDLFRDNDAIMYVDEILRDWSHAYLIPARPAQLQARRDMSELFAMLISFYRGVPYARLKRKFNMVGQQVMIVLGSYVSMTAYERWFKPVLKMQTKNGMAIDVPGVLTGIENRMKYIDIKEDTRLETREQLRNILSWYLDIDISEQVLDKYIFDAGGAERAL